MPAAGMAPSISPTSRAFITMRNAGMYRKGTRPVKTAMAPARMLCSASRNTFMWYRPSGPISPISISLNTSLM